MRLRGRPLQRKESDARGIAEGRQRFAPLLRSNGLFRIDLGNQLLGSMWHVRASAQLEHSDSIQRQALRVIVARR
jgi:hypothetical protein